MTKFSLWSFSEAVKRNEELICFAWGCYLLQCGIPAEQFGVMAGYGVQVKEWNQDCGPFGQEYSHSRTVVDRIAGITGSSGPHGSSLWGAFTTTLWGFLWWFQPQYKMHLQKSLGWTSILLPGCS